MTLHGLYHNPTEKPLVERIQELFYFGKFWATLGLVAGLKRKFEGGDLNHRPGSLKVKVGLEETKKRGKIGGLYLVMN
jgi:hypothetical protein